MSDMLLKRMTIEYWAEEAEKLTPERVEILILDCLHEETVRKLANDYCPTGVKVVVKGY